MTRPGSLLAALTTLLAWAWCARAQLVDPPRCPSRPSDAPPRCLANRSHGQNEYPYTVDGSKLQIEYTDSGYFLLTCPENVTLDNPALPRFESQLRVNKVQLSRCPPPRVSYFAALGALNVLVLDKLKLTQTGNLTRTHFAGLQELLALELTQAELARGTLEALPALRRLHLDRVRLPPDELLRLPRSLEMLQLVRMNTSVPAAVLTRLPALVNVTVRDSKPVLVEPAGALQGLALEMPTVHVEVALLPSLRRLSVFSWDERRPAPWAACDALDTLVTHFAAAEELPAGWLRRCGRVRVLHLLNAWSLARLDATSLRGARDLRDLSVTSSALTALPAGLLDDAERLSRLDLSGNKLLELPGGLFARTKSLQSLNLYKNNLTTRVFSSLAAVTSLTYLKLSNNIHLKDSCGGVSGTVRGSSPLQYLKQLTELYLRNTGASMICRDWRESMPLLETLDLAKNNFTSITYADLQFSADVTVNLSGNNVTKLYYTRHDYEQATAAVETSRATVLLDATLSCDCDVYWAARALRDRPAHVKLQVAACASGDPLHTAPLDDLVCAAPALCSRAPPHCHCAVRERDAAPPHVLRVRCERAGLARLADLVTPVADAMRNNNLSAEHFSWQLSLAHNRIARLTVADLPTHLSVLDLRYNNLTYVRADAANALLADDARRVWLAHNPLVCNCTAADTLAVLRARRAALADYDNVTCADLSPLGRAHIAPCPLPSGPSAPLVAGAAVLLTLVAAGALLGLMAHPALRLRIKELLHGCGWLPAEPDDGRRFDVFVSFSHGDERFVRDELVARLESGPAPYRLCVHYRDWVPGGWIPAQIAASVRASRRTVAVVSEHFLRSAWARAEFQEAYALALRDARPRLVVVLLDEPDKLPLDDKLRSYLATNTYVRWGDPWFWQKLRLALPRGRGLAPAGEAAIPVSPAAPAVPASPAAPAAPAPLAAPASRVAPLSPLSPAPVSATPPVCIGPSPREGAASPTTSLSPVSSSSSSSCSSSSPTYSDSSPTSSSAMELDLLVKPTCGAQYASDVISCAVPLRSQV